MKSKKISKIFNLIVVCVLLFSALFISGQSKSIPIAQAGAAQMPAPILTFEGLRRDQADPTFSKDSLVPDTSGAVGPTRYIQATNKAVALYDKLGTGLALSTFEMFWAGQAVGTPCAGGTGNHHGQPTVIYDHIGQRWFIADLAYASIDNGPYYFCMAVTNSTVKDTPVDFTVASWNYYTLNAKVQQNWPDLLPSQVKVGLWSDGFYFAFDQADVYNQGLTRTPYGVGIWAVNRDDLENGVTSFKAWPTFLPEEWNYHGLIPATLEGDPPAGGTPEFFGSIALPNKLYLFKLSVDWIHNVGTVFTTTPTVLYMNQPYSGAYGFTIPQKGMSEKLQDMGDRLTSLKYRQIPQCANTAVYCPDVQASLWAAHSSWNGTSSQLRWYEIRNPNSSPMLYQEGIYAPTAGDSRWISDLAVDVEGNMAIGYSISGAGMYPSIRYAGRTVSDPINTLLLENTLLDRAPYTESNTTYQNNDVIYSANGAWGQKSSMSVDPVDQCIFWYTNEYYYALEPLSPHLNWHTRIGWFRFPGCGSGGLTRVSLSTTNMQGNGSSGIDFHAYSTAVSADGRYVAFTSDATNFASPDVLGYRDVFLRDRDVDEDGILDETGQVLTTRISNGPGGTEALGHSWQVSMSADGQYIAFSSQATNLLSSGGDANGPTMDVFLYDAQTQLITLVSLSSGGTQGNLESSQPAISANGRFIAFSSYATNLVSGDVNNASDIFVRDLWYNKTYMVSVPNSGMALKESGADSYTPAISPDGWYIAFYSESDNMDDVVGGPDANTFPDVYIHDFWYGETVLGSVNDTGTASTTGVTDDSYAPSITSTDTEVRLAYGSRGWIKNTVYPFDGVSHIIVRVMDLYLVGINMFGFPATPNLEITSYVGARSNADSYAPAISADGRYVAFASDASNLDVRPYFNGVTNVFLKDLEIGSLQRVSSAMDGYEANGNSRDPSITADGQQVIFSSNASNLVVNDTNNLWDVFAFDKRRNIPNFLTIPAGIPAAPNSTVTVPVNFTPSGQEVDSISFSVDFDETCLTFTDASGAVVFNVGGSFTTSYTYQAGDKDGELDFSIYPTGSPSPALAAGQIATIKLGVKGTCQAAPNTFRTARVGFSRDPKASFGRNGDSITARSSDGSISISPASMQGDCNGDGIRDAGDISGLVNEIFDADGNQPVNVPLSTFIGSPVGCNPNNDTLIDAGDVSCMAKLMFGDACSGGMASLTATVSIDPLIKLAGPSPLLQGVSVKVPVQFTGNGSSVNSLVFSVVYDPAKMYFDPADANADSIPDALNLSLPAGFQAFVAQQTEGQIGVVVLNLSDPDAVLADGNLGEMTFFVPRGAPVGETQVTFSTDPAVSFGGNGLSLTGASEPYLTNILNTRWVYLPGIRR